MGVG
jgi:hypothetical protein